MDSDLLTIFSLVSSIASFILAIVAIALSVIFFQMSTKASERAKESANSIAESVNKLELLFGRLYNDTYSTLRETYADIRKHAWIKDENLVKDEDIKKLIEDKIIEINQTLKNQDITEEKIDAVHNALDKTLNEIIKKSKQIEEDTKKGFVKELILNMLYITNGLPVSAISSGIQGLFDISMGEIKVGFEELRNQNIINYEDPLRISTKIFLKEKNL